VFGWGKAVTLVRDLLVASGELTWGTGWDALGRPHRGLYLPSDLVVAISRRQIHPVALRRLRLEADLTSAQLGKRVGVCANTITRWETEVLGIPPYRVPTILEALHLWSAQMSTRSGDGHSKKVGSASWSASSYSYLEGIL